jgi:DNA-binding IclR family transcriptional regulator
MSPGDYEKELEAARSRGYALSREELIAGAVAIAAPFFNGGGKAAGSIGVFGPSVRMNKQRIDPLGASF